MSGETRKSELAIDYTSLRKSPNSGVFSLPFSTPTLPCFTFSANALSVLEQYPETHPWIYSNFVQLMGNTSGPFNIEFFRQYDFSLNPWLKVNRINKSFIEIFSGNPIKSLEAFVKEGYYISLYLDDYYVPAKAQFGAAHLLRENVIYGFDSEAQTFNLFGYDQKSRVASIEFWFGHLGFNDFNAAYASMMNVELGQDVRVYRFRDKGEYTFDLQFVVDMLKEYRGGMNSSVRYRAVSKPVNAAYGTNIYPILQSWLVALITGEVHDDSKNLQTLWEHKRMMTRRINYMENEGILPARNRFLEEFRDIDIRAEAMQHMFSTYNVGGQKKVLERIAVKIDKLSTAEAEAIDRVLDFLEHR